MQMVKTPHIVRPLRYLRDKLAQHGLKGEVTYPPVFHEARHAANRGDGKKVQDIARRVHALVR
jgi:hypothetical protein